MMEFKNEEGKEKINFDKKNMPKNFDFIQTLLLMNENETQFIIRVYALIKCRGLVDLRYQNELVKSAPEESFHLCVFENLVDGISEEEVYRTILNEDLLKEGLLNKWVLADVDGTMKGNSLIKK